MTWKLKSLNSKKRGTAMKQISKAEKIRLALEEFEAQLNEWLYNVLDNECVSDGLYGFVKDMRDDVYYELQNLELEMVMG